MTTYFGTFRRPSRSDWLLIGAFWVLASFFILSGEYREQVSRVTKIAIEVASHTAIVFTIVYWIFPSSLPRRRYWLLFLGMFLAMSGGAFLYRLIFGLACSCYVRLDWPNTFNTMGYMAWQAGYLITILVGKHFFEAQQRLAQVEKERAEAELRHLKAQIDPHFLFNNLNVLGALIQRNPAEATDYLHRFAALYRYLIRHKDDDVVPLADELAFVNDYTYLIQQRFGHAYELVQTLDVPDTLAVFVSPGAVQAVVENAVKHNQGSDTDPLRIEVTINEKTISVSNQRRPKLTPTESMGTGLQNLKARYKLLSDTPVQVRADARMFVVELPVLRAIL
jgi:two-component system, LytTR family, sensor kinase